MEGSKRRHYELQRDETKRTIAWYVDNNQYFAHFHETIELVYVEAGILSAMQNGETHLVAEGSLIVNSSYVVHSYSTPEASRIIVVTIPLSTVPSLRGMLAQNSFSKGIVDTREIKESRQLMRMMAHPAWRDNVRFVNSLGEALLSLLIQEIGLETTVTDVENDLVKRILSYVQENATAPLSVAGVAAHFGYSAGRFSHIFNERVGCPFIRYLNSMRCRMASRMLEERRAPLIDVASACGFASMRTFHRAYKQYIGETPGGKA